MSDVVVFATAGSLNQSYFVVLLALWILGHVKLQKPTCTT